MISQDAQPFNPDRLKQLLGDDAKAIVDVIRIACETLPPAAGKVIDKNLSCGEARSIAHQIKGASRTAGADELAAIAESLEQELTTEWTPKSRSIAASLPAAARRFLAATATYLRSVQSK